jgi:hypothetical protein
MTRVSLRSWQEWTERDDRSWLAALSARQWSTTDCHKSLKALLEPIVFSLHFSAHSRWGVQIPAGRLQEIMVAFLDWMRESKEWTRLSERWKASGDGPWSLPLALARSFVRYRETLPEEKTSAGQSGLRSLAELPSPLHETADLTSGAVIDAFASLAHQLPAGIRLSYQLHLEGLLDDEIAALLQLEPSVVSEHVTDAKALLRGELPKRSVLK